MTDASGLQLPATELAEGCYKYMFEDCTALSKAPKELPAETLAENCYLGMFDGCTNLNAVTCLATDISAEDSTFSWLNGVAATGTFTRAGTIGWPDGINGKPTGWNYSN